MPLMQNAKALACVNRHSFDIAREGYINLLLKKQPGDSKEMLVARRTFLERGHYLPLSRAINELIYTYQSAKWPGQVNILDAGCGEGYYLGQLQSYLTEHPGSTSYTYTGIDIARDAARMAARRYQSACFVVANLKERLTFADQTLHIILNIFAPRNAEEFARILAPHGLLLVVIPAPTHLHQLRSTLHLLNIEENKEQHVIEQYTDRFSLLASREISYTLNLQQSEIDLAVTMTPNYWHISDALRQEIARLTELQTELAFTCLLFGRK